MNEQLTVDKVLREVHRNRPVWVVSNNVGNVPLKCVDALVGRGLIRECTDEEAADYAASEAEWRAKEGEK